MRNFSKVNRNQTNETRAVVSLRLQRSLVTLFMLGAVCLGFFPTRLNAGEEQKSVEIQIGEMRGQVDRAVLIIVSPDWSFRRRGREEDLPNRGCRYELNDSASISPLMDILSRSQFPNDEEKYGGSLLMGIYLYAHDGSKTSFLFGYSSKSGDVAGTYNGQAIVAKAPFEKDIRALVAKTEPKEAHYTCEGDESIRLPKS